MSFCPFAVQKILPESHTQGHIEPRITILHSAGGHGSLYGFWLTGSSLESHFWVGDDGTIEQYMDTNTRADANLDANGYAVSIETESSQSASEPWSPRQLSSIIRLVCWLSDTHPAITRRMTPTPSGSGLGYHIMFGAPGPWTPHAKVCPGPERIKQTLGPVLQALTSGHAPPPPKPTEQEVTEAECKKIVNDAIKVLVAHVDDKFHSIGVHTDLLPNLQKDVGKVVAATDSLESSIGQIKTKVGA